MDVDYSEYPHHPPVVMNSPPRSTSKGSVAFVAIPMEDFETPLTEAVMKKPSHKSHNNTTILWKRACGIGAIVALVIIAGVVLVDDEEAHPHHRHHDRRYQDGLESSPQQPQESSSKNKQVVYFDDYETPLHTKSKSSSSLHPGGMMEDGSIQNHEVHHFDSKSPHKVSFSKGRVGDSSSNSEDWGPMNHHHHHHGSNSHSKDDSSDSLDGHDHHHGHGKWDHHYHHHPDGNSHHNHHHWGPMPWHKHHHHPPYDGPWHHHHSRDDGPDSWHGHDHPHSLDNGSHDGPPHDHPLPPPPPDSHDPTRMDDDDDEDDDVEEAKITAVSEKKTTTIWNKLWPQSKHDNDGDESADSSYDGKDSSFAGGRTESDGEDPPSGSIVDSTDPLKIDDPTLLSDWKASSKTEIATERIGGGL